ncbi:MAG: type II toxin-antitoxin system VapC family toxin [Anaerolineales bacterium]|nr:type II toxin-antitoxin system VapC family toxin [Anaerolineales bacterium]
MIVVDTNIIGYLYLTSAYSRMAEQALLKDSLWAAPLLWRSDLRNVLALYIRKELLTLAEAQQIMEEALYLMHGREYEVTSHQVLDLVATSSCSAYDCEFIGLAKDLDASLVTMDKLILKNFPDNSISLEAYVSE